MSIYEKVKRLASQNCETPQSLELYFGWKENSIRAWDSDPPPYAKMKQLADHFQVSIDNLQGRADDLQEHQ